jgi:cytidyltransferase-like protein
MPNFLLNDKHKGFIDAHKYTIVDNSISTYYLKSTWYTMQTYIPFWVAPNLITLCGLLSVIFGTIYCFAYYDKSPIRVTFVIILSIITYIFLDAIDGIHARKTKNTSPIGELLDHGCDSIVTILTSLMFCKFFCIVDMMLVWKFTIIPSLFFQLFHIQAYTKNIVFNKYDGPVEILCYFMILMLLKLVCPAFTKFIIGLLCEWSNLLLLSSVYFLTLSTFDEYMNKHHTVTTWLCKSVLCYVCFRYFFGNNFSLENTFYDGCAISFVTWELILNKIAKRDPGLVSILVLFTYCFNGFFGTIASLCLIIGYIKEIAEYLQINVLTQNINVYCCGVYDLCHFGHKLMFKRALEHGTRLIVGVHNDTEVKSYKRTPIMTMKERLKEVHECKNVWKAVPDALLLISQKELDDLNIHIVVCCEDYFNDSDKWYDLPRKLGILRSLPYTKEISTTELIQRCKNYVQ